MVKKLLASALLALSGLAFADEGISIDQGWIRLLPAELPAGGYFVLDNHTDHTITLTGVTAEGFARAMLHRSVVTNGHGEMHHVASIEVPAGGQLRFAPGGYHIMLMAPHDPLKPGDRVAVTLKFADGSTRRAEFLVKGAAARGWSESQ
ncbi:MAG: copper chaperone PCu(A)C [Nitrococcus mobilis]|nr:copper chaperone PCu(A)C [Nitrococcus mobilis]